MSALKKVVGLIAMAALIYFAPQLTPFISHLIGVSGFLASAIGTVIIAAGMYAIQSVFFNNHGQGVSQDASKVNVRIAEPPRWLCAGIVRQGGGVLFAEFDSAGNLWYLIVHSDSILIDTIQYHLDDIPVSLDGSGYVRNPEFRLKTNKAKDPATAMDEGTPYVQIWTTTYSETDPIPPRIAAFDAAFASKWTSDHHLAGTTFSVVKMTALPIEDRYKIYKYRGALGLGEPALTVTGQWSNMYDPRDNTQVLGDRTTYKPSTNAELIWAWFRTHPYGRRKAESTLNWDKIAINADTCDQSVVGLDGSVARYTCGIAIPDNMQRAEAERNILLSLDGQIIFDEDGKTWVSAGGYYTPTLSFYRNRDILAMESVEATNGESETQGVIVRYSEPDAKYTAQPSAPWINPLYYDPAQTPQFLTVDILACNNHNQAMRLAKAIGMRSQPQYKIAPIMGVRGLRARQERIIDIQYDNTFTGDHEIVAPIEIDAQGVICGMGLVPVDPDRWNLLPGEEKAKPVVDGSSAAASYPSVTAISLVYDYGVLILTMPALPRPDATYVADYMPTSLITGAADDPWLPMDFADVIARSGGVTEGLDYTVRYRYTTSSGNGPAWAYITLTPSSTGEHLTYLGDDLTYVAEPLIEG